MPKNWLPIFWQLIGLHWRSSISPSQSQLLNDVVKCHSLEHLMAKLREHLLLFDIILLCSDSSPDAQLDLSSLTLMIIPLIHNNCNLSNFFPWLCVVFHCFLFSVFYSYFPSCANTVHYVPLTTSNSCNTVEIYEHYMNECYISLSDDNRCS